MSGRPLPIGGLVAALLCVTTSGLHVAHAQPGTPAERRGQRGSRPVGVDPDEPDRVFNAVLLQQWVATVEEHTPGEVDNALLGAAHWSNRQLDRLWVDTQVLILSARAQEHPKRQRSRTRYRVSGRDGDTGARGPDETVVMRSSDQRAIDDALLRLKVVGIDTMLKKAALLHTDVATLAPEVAAQAAGATSVRTSVKTLVGDGNAAGAESVTAHWALARKLLAQLAPDPRAHTFVRDWYRATVALAQSTEFWDSIQLRHGMDLFPDDPVLNWLKGCQHEAYAAPLYQEFVRAFDFKSVRPEIDDRESELERAERHLRRALTGDPALIETRLHLGRVLALQGRRDEAIRELDAVLATTIDETIEYYGRLFLGAEQHAAGLHQAAYAQFRRATALAPESRVAFLAMAQIARELGNREQMQEHLDRALAPVVETTSVDPWWSYRSSQGRRAEAWMRGVRNGWREARQ